MNRRDFLTLSGAAGLAATTFSTTHAADAASGHDYYELRQVSFDTEEQKNGFDAFMKDAAIPALNRAGADSVGVFYPEKGFSPAYVLLRYPSIEAFLRLLPHIAADQELKSKGAAFINAPASAPAYKRYESSLMVAFKGMPHLEKPVQNPERVFQLRTYESPSLKTNLKKVEMFNDAGEIKIFREVGLNPVFFGETLIGTKLPNLTYMLGFKNAEEQQSAWKRFGEHPDWKRLRGMPEYADKTILSGITNILLKPADYSQI